MAGIGIPVKLLHESLGHICTIELKSGFVYRGKLIEVEDNMNCQLKQVTSTARDGKVTNIDQIYVRGSQIRFVICPDMLKHAPMFKRIASGTRGLGMGRGASHIAARGRGRGTGVPSQKPTI